MSRIFILVFLAGLTLVPGRWAADSAQGAASGRHTCSITIQRMARTQSNDALWLWVGLGYIQHLNPEWDYLIFDGLDGYLYATFQAPEPSACQAMATLHKLAGYNVADH